MQFQNFLLSHFTWIILVLRLSDTKWMTYVSPEHPRVEYYNKNYVGWFNVTSRRYSRNNAFYYVSMEGEALMEIDNRFEVSFIFYEFLTNTYKRSFVEFHFRVCDMMHQDNFFGVTARMAMPELAKPCPYPRGEYHLMNMTVPLNYIPRGFPFKKGRMYTNVTDTKKGINVGHGYIDLEFKGIDVKNEPTKKP